jgi:hypothetical protein
VFKWAACGVGQRAVCVLVVRSSNQFFETLRDTNVTVKYIIKTSISAAVQHAEKKFRFSNFWLFGRIF